MKPAILRFMTTYLVLYRAANSAAEQMSGQDPEQAAAGMEAWMTWAQTAGEAIVDLGAPTQTVEGVDPGATSFIGGYSLLQAESLDELKRILEGHPHLGWGGTIEILETLSMPGTGG